MLNNPHRFFKAMLFLLPFAYGMIKAADYWEEYRGLFAIITCVVAFIVVGWLAIKDVSEETVKNKRFKELEKFYEEHKEKADVSGKTASQ